MPYNIQDPGPPGRINEPKLVAKRAKLRNERRQEFLKLYTDPYRHLRGEGGLPFEPAFHRYFAMKNSQGEFFRPNFYTARLYVMIIIIPICSIYAFLSTGRARKEEKLRSGAVAYKDRHPKLL